MKISNEANVKIKNIKAAIDDAYDKLNVTYYYKNTGARVTYSEVNPFNSVADNFEYISTIIRELQGSEIIGDE